MSMSKYVNQLIVLCTLSILINACGLQERLMKQQMAEQIAAIEKQEREAMVLQQPLKEGEMIPVLFAQAQLEGNWKGSTCQEKMTVEIKMSARKRELFSAPGGVTGVFRSTDRSQKPNARVIETGLKGQFDLRTGFLNMGSIPKPLTEEEQWKENNLMAWEALEYRELQNKAMVEMINAQWEASSVKPDQVEQVNQKYLNKKKALEEKMQKIVTVQTQRMEAQKAAADATFSPFQIDMARNAAGDGWTGIIEGAAFDGCEIVLSSEQNVKTDKLPPITSQAALKRADFLNLPKVAASRRYWLNMAAKDAREEDFFYLGQLYEREGVFEGGGERSSENYLRAFDYYKILADKNGDARAQVNMGQMYEKGLGVTRNSAEAQRLYNSAAETKRKALSVCTAQKTQIFVGRMMQQAQQKARVLNIFAQLFTGIGMDWEGSRLVEIQTKDVASMDRPFVCNFVARRVHPSVDAEWVPDGYIVQDQYGNMVYEDRALDKLVKTGFAGVMEKLASMPFNNFVRIEPQGNLRYKLIWRDQLSQNSETVDLN